MKITIPRSQHSKLWSWDRPVSNRHTFQPCFLHFLAGACLNQSHQGTGQEGCQGHGDLLSRGGVQTQASRCCLNLSLARSWASHPFQWGRPRLCSSLPPSFPSGPSQPNASLLSQRGVIASICPACLLLFLGIVATAHNCWDTWGRGGALLCWCRSLGTCPGHCSP